MCYGIFDKFSEISETCVDYGCIFDKKITNLEFMVKNQNCEERKKNK